MLAERAILLLNLTALGWTLLVIGVIQLIVGFGIMAGVGGVLYSASTLFVARRDTLEVIWDVPYDSNLTTSLQSRAFGALMSIAAGVVLATIIVSERVLAFVEQQLSPALLDALVRSRE